MQPKASLCGCTATNKPDGWGSGLRKFERLDLVEIARLGLPVSGAHFSFGKTMLFLWRLGLAIALIVGAASAAAQQGKPPAAANAQGKAPAAPAQQGMTMSTAALAVLIKGTVFALHQANVTGNYSVLRDMGTPVFRERFDQAALTAAFSNLRARKIDLSPALLLAPNLTKNPEFNQNGELVLVGDFPTEPLLIHFELMFTPLDGVWRLAGMGVDAVPPPGPQAAAAASFAPAPASKKGPLKPKS